MFCIDTLHSPLQGAERGALERITARMTEAPGPGYYNYTSDFDLPEQAGSNSYADTNFLMQLNAARKRQSAVFESRTGRDSLMQEIKRKEGDPGECADYVACAVYVCVCALVCRV